jgi:hypothetical protein
VTEAIYYYENMVSCDIPTAPKRSSTDKTVDGYDLALSYEVRLYLLLLVGRLVSYLRYLCLLTHSGVQHILRGVFRRIVYPMLPVSLNCSCLICRCNKQPM